MERLDIEIGLRDAINRDELVLHYQPIVTPADGRIQGVEALVRWNRPGHGLVPPMRFIPIAEETGLIGEMGEWIINRAAGDVAGWRRAGLVEERFRLSVNLSARQLAQPSLIEVVRRALDASELPASMLCLEITESVVMQDPDLALDSLGQLKKLGVELAIDDFGVGQSSLEHVARLLPVSVIKLDRSFVMAMADERDLAVVSTVASLASSLRMCAVAEGVESAEQAQAVADLGYPLAQGFYFARPADAAAVRTRLEAVAACAA
jgi:EAL domain-containing protein (putative c-di-GMP-specific phosphodiesterase class I)